MKVKLFFRIYSGEDGFVKIKRILILALISIITLLITTGCSDSKSIIMSQKIKEEMIKEEIFKNDLIEEGLLIKLDNTVKVKDGSITLKEIKFDTNYLLVSYEIPEQLSFLNMKITGECLADGRIDNFTGFQRNNKTINFNTNPSFNTVTIRHNLKLVNQKINLDIEINNSHETIFIDFPGDKIALLTKEVFFNKEGVQVKDIKQAMVRVKIGINYLEIESTGYNKDFVVLDMKEKKVLSRTSSINSSKDAFEGFEKIPIHRKDINIKLLYSDRVVLINY